MTLLERWSKRTDVWVDMIPFIPCACLMSLPLLGCGCRHFCSKVDAKTICIMEQDSNPHKSILTGVQYVTPDSKIYCEKIKMCRFSSGNWFFLHQIRAACHSW
jgi:hypothetical protein